jgi:uncharacterized protein involved in exopolysaccharide biosynthesis
MRFFETFHRHWLLAILPIVIGVVVAAGYQIAQPPSYTSTASLWIDASVPGQSSSSSAYTGEDPSTIQEYSIQELLSTRSFAVAVGTSGPLAAYLTSNPHAEDTGLAAIPGLGSLFASNKSSVDDQISADLPNMVNFTDAGPQVLNITLTAPDSTVAAETLQALIAQYSAQVIEAQTASDQTSVDYYSEQVNQAQTTLQQAQQDLSAYVASHHTVSADDATETELQQAVSLDTSTYQSLLGQYQQAELTLANVKSQNGFRVLDAATVASVAVSTKKKLLEVGLVGLVVGLLVSVLLVSALTAMDRTARQAEDIKRTLGLEVAASIGHIPTAALFRGNQR